MSMSKKLKADLDAHHGECRGHLNEVRSLYEASRGTHAEARCAMLLARALRLYESARGKADKMARLELGRAAVGA